MKCKRLTASLLVIAVMLGICVVSRLVPSRRRQSAQPPLEIGRLRRLSVLMTCRANVTERMSFIEQGYLGSIRMNWTGEADLWLGTDLSRARIVDQNPANRTALVELARPQVLCVRVDPVASRLESIEFRGLWQAFPDTMLVDRVRRSLLERLDHHLRHSGSLAQQACAMRSAVTLVDQYGAAVGWTLSVRWIK